MNYKPKFYQSEKTELEAVDGKSVFRFKTVEGEDKEIRVDESISRIQQGMEEIKNGERKTLYLTHGMSDIDVRLLNTGKWQLFDGFDIYEFKIEFES